MSEQTIYEKLEARLVGSHEEMVSFFGGLNSAEWEQIILPESGWTVADELRHLMTVEQAIVNDIQHIIGDGAVEFAHVNLDAWNAEKVASLQSLPPTALLTKYKDTHAATMEQLAKIKDADWGKSSAHPLPEVGQLRVSGWFKLASIHRQMHIKDIAAALSA